MTPPPLADLVYARLPFGRDRAVPLSAVAEQMGVSRRAVEEAVQSLRHGGKPIASGSEGVWVTHDPAELWETFRSLRHRIAAQSATAWALRKTARAYERNDYQQTELFPAA